MGQALAGVVGHGLDQLLVNAALGADYVRCATANLAKPLGDGFFVLWHMLDDYPGRHHQGCCLVELLDELPQHQLFGIVLRALHEEVVAADQFALPNKEHLNPGLVSALRQGDHIHVADGVGIYFDPLFICHLLYGFDAVPQDCRALEFQLFRCLVHVGLQVIGDRDSVAVHEHDNLADDLGVVFLAGIARAGGHASVDVVLQARAGVFARDVLGARTVWKQPLDQVHGLPHGVGGGEGSEIPRPVLVVHLAGDVHPREFLAQINLEIRVGLVVFQAGVVAGFVPLDERILQDQRLGRRVGDDVLEIVEMPQHSPNLVGQVGG